LIVFFLFPEFFLLEIEVDQIDEPMHLLLPCHFLSMIDLLVEALQFLSIDLHLDSPIVEHLEKSNMIQFA
jgi:hypothetical protein